MDKPQPPIITEHRRKRLTLWALTVLGWLHGLLFGTRDVSARQFNQRFHHILFEDLTRTAIAILIARTLQLLPRIRHRVHPWKHGRSLRRSHFLRSMLGARLRSQLKHKDLATRIARLTAMLRDLDKHAGQLARRIRGRLRRLWRELPPIAPAALILGPPASPPAFANSS